MSMIAIGAIPIWGFANWDFASQCLEHQSVHARVGWDQTTLSGWRMFESAFTTDTGSNGRWLQLGMHSTGRYVVQWSRSNWILVGSMPLPPSWVWNREVQVTDKFSSQEGGETMSVPILPCPGTRCRQRNSAVVWANVGPPWPFPWVCAQGPGSQETRVDLIMESCLLKVIWILAHQFGTGGVMAPSDFQG